MRHTDRCALSLAFLLAAIGLAGCGSSDGERAIVTMRSWAATSEMVTRAWLEGAAPQHYAVKTLDTALRELERQSRKIPAGRQPLEHGAAVRALVGSLRAGIEAGDRPTVARDLAALGEAMKAVAAERISS